MEAPRTPEEFRAVWDAKPALRAVYADCYAEIARLWRPGRVVEVGAGSGNLAASLPGVRPTDITPAPWLHAVVDAQCMPFADGSLTSVVGMDVLHHVEWPRRFLREAARVLEPGGRLVLVEPAITPVSRVAFRLGHPEPVIDDVDPLADGAPDPERDPFDANQSLPTLLAGRHRHRVFAKTGLQVIHAERFGVAAYPLSGGFRRWSLLPARLAPRLVRLEHRLPDAVRRLAAFRLLLAFERPLDQG